MGRTALASWGIGRNSPSFWNRLKRRHVVRAGIAYLIVGAGVGGSADAFLPALGAPEWVLPTVMALLVLGLPVALVLAWAYEVTPDGIVRDAPEAVIEEPHAETAAPPIAVRPEEGRRSIVVLPFDNMSPDPNDAHFSDGHTGEITTQLSYLRSLRVISRSSAMVFKNNQKDIRTIGRELGEYVMEGSVRKAGESLRITAQLIDAASDEHLWAETYARQLEDVFEVQADIALSVAAMAYMGIGDHERALGHLERVPEHRPPGNDTTSWLGVLPHFAPIRDHPRVQAVLKRLGLPSVSPEHPTRPVPQRSHVQKPFERELEAA